MYVTTRGSNSTHIILYSSKSEKVEALKCASITYNISASCFWVSITN